MIETSLFPYEKFPIRLDIKSQNRVCWFECEHHLNKLIDREKLQPKDYELHTNNLEIVADQVAILRTVIFTTYLVTNCFIVAGVIRHWNDKQTINIEIYENANYAEKLYSEGWNNLGVGGNSRIEGIYRTATVQNRTGEFE
jgi:hypothetical protein